MNKKSAKTQQEVGSNKTNIQIRETIQRWLKGLKNYESKVGYKKKEVKHTSERRVFEWRGGKWQMERMNRWRGVEETTLERFTGSV